MRSKLHDAALLGDVEAVERIIRECRERRLHELARGRRRMRAHWRTSLFYKKYIITASDDSSSITSVVCCPRTAVPAAA